MIRSSSGKTEGAGAGDGAIGGACSAVSDSESSGGDIGSAHTNVGKLASIDGRKFSGPIELDNVVVDASTKTPVLITWPPVVTCPEM